MDDELETWRSGEMHLLIEKWPLSLIS